MSYQLRNYRHRNPKGGEEKKGSTPFFQAPKQAVARKKKKDGFFQAKGTDVQRLATSKEDEKLGTNDARMEKDKEEPMKPVQKKDKPGKEEEKPVQKKGKDKKEEEKPVQKKGKEDEKKKKKKGGSPEKGKPVQKKEKPQTSTVVAEEIKQQSGKGSPLPPRLLAEMGKSFGCDFSHVRIHHDAAAAKLCQELHAMAFTHGQDIYFNEGKYNPESAEGKKLLAHELTHVVQQANSIDV